MKIIYAVLAYLLVILGVGHTLMTPTFYPIFSADALWFAGTGLALLFLGLFNIAAIRTSIRLLLNLCLITNFVALIFLALVAVAVPENQAFVALTAAFGLIVSALAFRKNGLEIVS